MGEVNVTLLWISCTINRSNGVWSIVSLTVVAVHYSRQCEHGFIQQPVDVIIGRLFAYVDNGLLYCSVLMDNNE